MATIKPILPPLSSTAKCIALLLGTSLLTQSHLQAQDVMKVQSGAVITVQSGSQMVVQGGVNLDNGSVLNNSGTIILKQNSGAGAANWTDASVAGYSYGTGKVIFNGTGGHLVNTSNTFGEVDIDAAGHVNLAGDLKTSKLLLVNGKVNTGSSFKAIVLGTSQLALEADPTNVNFANSWINGNLRRSMTPASVNTYEFPVGDATKVNRAILTNLTANPLNNLTYIDASFGAKPGNDIGLIATENGQPYVAVSNGGVWFLTPDVAPSAGAYDALLYFNGFSGLGDNTFAILKRPTASSAAVDWAMPAGSVLPANNQPGRIVSAGYARRNNITSFSQLGIGIMSGALPVTMLDFDAKRLSKVKVLVNWKTLTEQNNLGFDVERRLDGEAVFAKIGFASTKAPDGNSNSALDYNFTDANGYAGVSYYRLKQVDRDLRGTYTLIKAVKGMGETQVSVLLYPNPNYGQFTIRLDGVTKTYDATITDMSGKLVKQLKLGNYNNINITGLSAGTYLIHIPDVFGAGESFTEKVMIVK